MAWNPDQYNQFKFERSLPFYDLLSLIEAGEIKSAVDLGCGTGELTRILHERLKITSTLGLDNSNAMLEKSRPVPGLSFTTGSIEKFQTEAGYDLVFSNAALQWVEDHPSIFKNLKTALNPHGQLAIQMPYNHDYPTHVIADELGLDFGLPPRTDPLPAETYSELLGNLGFAKKKVEIRIYSHALKNREDVVEWVKGTMLTHFESRLPPERYQEFLTEYRSRLFQILPDVAPLLIRSSES